MNKTAIEWCDMTWNPVTGCLHRCPYCYADRQVERFSGIESEKLDRLAERLGKEENDA